MYSSFYLLFFFFFSLFRVGRFFLFLFLCCLCCFFLSFRTVFFAVFFFFSSRRRHTRCSRDWEFRRVLFRSRAVTSRTRLIILTNLHNPSGVLTEDSVLQQVGEIARSVGARVLVDEVYLDAAFTRAPRSAFHLGEHFVVTSSLTKVYGLSGLRCGWVLAAPDLAERMWRLNDLFGVAAAHPAERLSVVALDHLDEIAAHARALLETNRALLKRFLDSRDDLRAVWPEAGTMVFPRLVRGTVDSLCARLQEVYETSVVPGTFFEMPEHFRIGIGGDTKMVAEGLERLAAALDAGPS